MKILSYLTFVMLLSCEKSYNPGVNFSLENAKGSVILDASKKVRDGGGVSGQWLVGYKTVHELEPSILRCIKAQLPQVMSPKGSGLAAYYRQYLGLQQKRKKLVVVNFFMARGTSGTQRCKADVPSSKDWRTWWVRPPAGDGLCQFVLEISAKSCKVRP